MSRRRGSTCWARHAPQRPAKANHRVGKKDYRKYTSSVFLPLATSGHPTRADYYPLLGAGGHQLDTWRCLPFTQNGHNKPQLPTDRCYGGGI